MRAFTLFATHYFELTALATELPGVVNLHLDATEHGEDLVFLHAVKEGPANRSYGLAVARLAGVPRDVVGAARGYLAHLESERDRQAPPPLRRNCRSSQHPPSRRSRHSSPPCTRTI